MSRGAVTVAATAAAVLGILPASAQASCIPRTSGDQLRAADVVVDAIALEGPTASGVQRFRAIDYVKNSGPSVVRVATGVVARPDGTGSTTSVSIEAAAGEKWRIYAVGDARRDVLETSVCAGSRRLTPSERSASTAPEAPAGDQVSALGSGRMVVLATAGLVLLAAVAIARARRRRS